jgi:hypothetical protein
LEYLHISINRGNCTAWRQAGLCSQQVAGMTAKLQRCPAFAPAVMMMESNND